MTALLARLGGLLARRAWWFVAAWLLVLALAVPAARWLPSRLTKSPGDIPGSQASAVRRALTTDFRNPFVDPLFVAVRAPALDLRTGPARAALEGLVAQLRGRPEVARVVAPWEAGTAMALASPDGHVALVLVGYRGGPEHAGEAVAAVRAVAGPVLAELGRRDAGLQAGVTGPSAFVVDVIGRNATDSARAESRVMLPAALLLLLAFGTPLAALLPLLVGVAATILTLAAAAGLAGPIALNGYVQTAGTMLGLALGIDYALIMVGRYREERRAGLPPAEAAPRVLATAGWTVACSGAVVLAAMAALIPSGLVELQSVGVGGALTVFWAVLLATTLLPAVLVLADRWLDVPRWPFKPAPVPRWEAWGHRVARWRWPVAVAVLAALVALALPAGRFKVGLPDGKWYPADLEAARGAEVLHAMEQAGLGFPFQVLVRRTDGGPILDPQGLKAMAGFSKALRQRPEVKDVLGPVDLPGARGLLPSLIFFRDPRQTLAKHPLVDELFISTDRTRAAMQVVLRDDTPLSRGKALAGELRRLQAPGLEIQVGGLTAAELDLETFQVGYAPVELGLVFITSFVLLFVAFRSVLIPLKAIALNLLAVGAAMGLVVRVFQDGWLHEAVGLAAPLTSVPLTLPLMIFCLCFGLSMDYEVFMLARVREARALGEEAAIAHGLAATAGTITAAAAIMVLVFGAFVGAEMALVKILGFGLAVAILLDATVIRLVLAPALLAIAGQWNWWPGASSRSKDSSDS